MNRPRLLPKAQRGQKIRISTDALAYASLSGEVDEHSIQEAVEVAFKPAEPFPGVVPKGDKARLKATVVRLGMDATLQEGFGWAAMNAVFAEGLQFMGYQYLAELTQRAEYRRPSEILAKEMTRKWIKLHSTATEGDDKTDKIQELEGELKRLNVQRVFRTALEQDGFFGRSQVYIDVGVQKDDREEFKSPLLETIAKVKKGKKIERLTVVEPIWTYPNWFNANDPLDPTFFHPETWFVMGNEVHNTRFMTFVGRPVPDLLKPAYAFGGLSLSQMLKPYVDNWLRTRQSVSDIVHAFSVFVLKTNLSEILSGGAATEVFKRLSLFTRMRDNRGVFALDKDTEEFENVSAPLGSLDKLQAQAQEHMSAVVGIPFIVLFGVSPAGLNASSEGEIKTFQDWIAGKQEAEITPHLTRLINLIQLSLWGEIDKDIGFTYVPLWSLDEKGQADVDKIEAETDGMLIDKGVIDPSEARERLAKKNDSPYANLDLNKVIEPPEGGLGGGEEDLGGKGREGGGGTGGGAFEAPATSGG